MFGKRTGMNLKRNKGVIEVEKLRAQLAKLTASFGVVLEAKELEVGLSLARVDVESWQQLCLAYE